MKKIFVLFLVLLISIMSACSFDESSKQDSVKNVYETVAVESSEKTVITKTDTKTAQTSVAIPKAENLNLGETDEWSFNSRSKFIYFTNYGRYYPVETSELKNKDYEDACGDIARHDAVYNLCLDDGSEKTVLDSTRNCMTYYCDGNFVYIYKYDNYDTHDNDGIYKLYKGDLTKLADYPDNGYISAVCFTNEQIYYSIFDEKKSAVYKMDYDGGNVEHVFDNPTKIWDMTVYNEKIWFERSFDMYQIHGLACYDMKTTAVSELKENHIGYINNNYMYYSEGEALYRINLSNFACENIIKLDDYLISFDFHKDYILYSSGCCLYKMNDNENTLIFSAENYFVNESYEIRDIQCQDNHIYILIGSGAFYQCIMEIDIDGNVIGVIHED